jgi:hypothetical protein
MADATSLEAQQLADALASGVVSRERTALAAYLGYPPAKVFLGHESPPAFSLESMTRGGDRRWRVTMRELGHESAAVAACAIAELALAAYLTEPDSIAEVGDLAQEAVAALRRWRSEPQSATRRAEVEEKGCRFCLAVQVGGRLQGETGYRGGRLGFIIGKCYSTVVAPDNRRHVRWLGEAAEATCHQLKVSEVSVCAAVSDAVMPYVFPEAIRGKRSEPSTPADSR